MTTTERTVSEVPQQAVQQAPWQVWHGRSWVRHVKHCKCCLSRDREKVGPACEGE
jgi:hypothetical protein